MSRNNRTDCDCDIEISHSLTMVVICRPLLLPKAHKKQFNQISCKNTLLLQSFRSITVNFSPFYHQSSDIRTICRELKKTSENNRSRWLSKNNRTDCDGKKWPKTSTSHRCYKKNIGIASLSKIDHRWSLISIIIIITTHTLANYHDLLVIQPHHLHLHYHKSTHLSRTIILSNLIISTLKDINITKRLHHCFH